jgi:hypothetical protein
MAVRVGGAADFSGAFNPYSLSRFTLVYLPAALAVMASGAADFSSAFDTPPQFTLIYLPAVLAVVVSGAADFSGAFDTPPRFTLVYLTAGLLAVVSWQPISQAPLTHSPLSWQHCFHARRMLFLHWQW